MSAEKTSDLSQMPKELLLKTALEIVYKTIEKAESQGRLSLRDAALYCKTVALEALNEYKSRSPSTEEITEEQVKAMFAEGMELFKKGEPPPSSEDRIRFMGWRAAKQSQEILNQGLANMIEAYIDLGRKIKTAEGL